MTSKGVFVHATADVSDAAQIGEGTKIWSQVQIREGAVIGKNCIFGKGSYVDKDVRIGDNCKLQNGVFVFHGMDLEAGVFLGPGVMLLNDKHPRAINPDGSLKSEADWEVSKGVIGYGAAVGGGAVVLPGVKVGRWALVGSGAVVTRNVPDRGIVAGNPARVRGFACDCGHPLSKQEGALYACGTCGRTFEILSEAEEAVRRA